ncbi:Abi-alpha family protein [Bradyrhizobium sp. SZCCHNRI1058]|uniref:Abi-alpha family protein n=1 Tax=Bradyrhizobium sp. SZCCHNRI1058 TaxID=3057279 RepID=UPI00291616C0|nr:Abi-alpha family protein [Bradyrhizobium sp. SZCCHNRI1058]
MTNDLIPVTDAQAKAAEEALKTLQGFGGFLKETFGTVPQDIVGLLGGDYLKVRRAENARRLIEKAKKRLEDAGVEKPDAPPSLAIPIIVAAADESRDELLDLWAALLAAAADPARSKSFRLKFIEIVKQLDPLDAPVLKILVEVKQTAQDKLDPFTIALGATADEVSVSIQHLKSIGLAERGSIRDDSPGWPYFSPTALGRELLRTLMSS